MKYLKEFLEQQYKIRSLGELTSEEYYEIADGALVGEEIVIDGFKPGIIIWYADYAQWLEKRLSNYIENIESEI
jgi:hypothetical protein